MKFLYIVLFITLVSACALPWPVTVLSTGVDIIMKKETGKTPLEHGASSLTGTDCNFTRVIDGVFPCMTSEEYVDYLFDMDCDEYTWDNMLQIPICKKVLDNPSKG